MADKRPRMLIPITRARTAAGLLEVAAGILRSENGSGVLVGVVELPQGRPIAESVTVARRYRSLLQRITELETRVEARFGVQVRVASNLAQGVREAAYESSADLIVLEWPGLSSPRHSDRNIEDLVADPPADLLLVRQDPAGSGVRADAGVLVPVRGGPSARLALRAAAALVGSRRTPITALHVHDVRHSEERRARASRQFHDLLVELGTRRVEPVEIVSVNPSQAITDAGRRHGVTVLGAFADAARSSVLVGSRLAKTVESLPGTVILAKSSRSIPPILGDEIGAPSILISGRDISGVVDKWFAENTFHSREFADVGRLVDLKRRQGLTISLGLPTLNEEDTIGDVLHTLKGELMDGVPLLDEIVVIDSASTDRTAEVADSLGVPVVQHPDVLPEHGTFRGKGEALWKSLHVLRGDIVAWCDTDISNIHPQFVYGTVGPLLTDPRVSYVKGFYRRPLNFGGELQSAGGGRVTELAARPLFNLFYPLLSGLVQPLSGEYAGRRELLERLPFFTGYGVETGHLIDVVENFGLNCIAQTDLGVRIHRNQELLDLSKMAFAIMQVALKRLGDRHRIHLLEEINRSMKLIHHDNDRFFLEVMNIGDWERPPMAAIPEYLMSRAPAALAEGGR
ncbi:MAG TPA: glucosyl-3-phosphoglycerate synthase [Candidatus Dormibacteraeota bacterium]|nr:glucosyl-3-phosphoglycerate synthase [Candidatus Dormibacteraeota bacterium]